jgi:prepilin-type processing-associated H-X9-DG protein
MASWNKAGSTATPLEHSGTWPLGWAVAILPNMEQTPLYNALNVSNGCEQVQNTTVTYSKVATYVCPSEGISQGPWVASSYINYAANLGGPASIAAHTGIIVPMSNTATTTCHCHANGNIGSFGTQGIPDGTSNTAMFSEKLIGVAGAANVRVGSANARRVIYSATGAAVNPDTNNAAEAQAFVAACKAVPGTAMNVGSSQWNGAAWSGSHGGTYRFNAYSHVNTPNGLSCTPWGSEDPGFYGSAITAGSFHPGGVNICFGDGSVKFVKDTINTQTWWAIGSRNQSEVVSADAY